MLGVFLGWLSGKEYISNSPGPSSNYSSITRELQPAMAQEHTTAQFIRGFSVPIVMFVAMIAAIYSTYEQNRRNRPPVVTKTVAEKYVSGHTYVMISTDEAILNVDRQTFAQTALGETAKGRWEFAKPQVEKD